MLVNSVVLQLAVPGISVTVSDCVTNLNDSVVFSKVGIQVNTFHMPKVD